MLKGRLISVLLDFEEIGVFAHKVCDGSVRDKDSRWIFLSASLLTRNNSHLQSYKDYKSDTY